MAFPVLGKNSAKTSESKQPFVRHQGMGALVSDTAGLVDIGRLYSEGASAVIAARGVEARDLASRGHIPLIRQSSDGCASIGARGLKFGAAGTGAAAFSG